MTSGSLWNYYRNEVNDYANKIVADRRLNNSKTTTSKSFEYKAKIKVRTAANSRVLNTKVVVPLKYLSNFWTSIDLPLINCTWSDDCVICEMVNNAEVPANPAGNPPIYVLQKDL